MHCEWQLYVCVCAIVCEFEWSVSAFGVLTLGTFAPFSVDLSTSRRHPGYFLHIKNWGQFVLSCWEVAVKFPFHTSTNCACIGVCIYVSYEHGPLLSIPCVFNINTNIYLFIIYSRRRWPSKRGHFPVSPQVRLQCGNLSEILPPA